MLVSSSRSDSQIRIEFDAMHPVPTKAELADEFGPDVEITKFSPNVISGTRGTVVFRLDVRDGEGRMSSKAAESLYKAAFGTSERIQGKSSFEKIPLEERFTLGRAVEGDPTALSELRGKGFTNTALPARTEAGFIQLPAEFNGALDHGVDLIRRGVQDFARWSAEMVRRFGEAVRDYLADVWAAATKTSEKGAVNVTALNDLAGHAKEIARKFSEVPKFTPLKRVVNGWVGRMQASSIAVRKVMKEIEQRVPDAKRREAITNWIQAGGDDAVLAAREAQSTGPRKQGYRLARDLTGAEKALAQRVRGYYDQALAKAQSHGLVDEGIDNYVNQVWKRPMTLSGSNALAGFTGQLSRSFKFGQKRSFESFFEGEKAGFEPVTKDVGKLLGLYLTELNKTIATREMIGNLTTGAASDGRPLAVPEGGVMPKGDGDAPGTTTLVLPGSKANVAFEGTEHDVKDYKSPDAPALAKWKFVTADTDGKPVMVLGRLALHPEAYSVIENALGRSRLKKWAESQADSGFGHVARLLFRAGEALQNQVKINMMSLSPFHIVQEGTHAIGHRTNPFASIPTIDYNNPAHVDAMNHGLMLAGDRTSMAQFMDGLSPKGSWLEFVIPGLGKFNRVASEFTFEHYIPGLKYKTYEHALARNMLRLQKDIDAGKVSVDDVKYGTAKQMNAAYGHMNYKDMGRDPTIQHILRLTLLAPDFLEARGKFTGQAIQGLAGGKLGREQAVAMATLAILFYVGARVGNALANNGDTKNDLDHLFAVEVGNRIYTMRSVPEDIYRLVHDWRKFTAGRVSPLIGTGVLEGLFGVNYRGEKVSTGEAVQDALANGIPMSVRMVPGLRDLTRTQKNHPVSPWEQFMGAAGLQIGRHSPITQTQKMAHEFSEAMGSTDTGSYPVSKYQQLRYALEDLNWDKAAIEIKTLLGEKGKHSDLRKHFHESLFRNWTTNKKMDKQWEETLKPDQKAMLQEAEERRKAVWQRFMKLLPVQ
jgi:hypothetical protein